MKYPIIIGISALCLNGCAALIPNTLTPEVTHVSHATQHAPFTNHTTEYGANIADIALRWNLTANLHVELAEGISLDHKYRTPTGGDYYGEVLGPREQFIGRIGYSFKLKD